MSIMTTSAHFAASDGVMTLSPAFFALAAEGLPSRRPTATFTPESFRLLAWANPWEP